MNSAYKPGIAQSLRLGAACLCAMASAFFGLLYYGLYWKYRGLFNELGRYYDERDAVVYHDQAAILIVPTVASLLLAFLFFSIWLARRRSMVAHAAGGA